MVRVTLQERVIINEMNGYCEIRTRAIIPEWSARIKWEAKRNERQVNNMDPLQMNRIQSHLQAFKGQAE